MKWTLTTKAQTHGMATEVARYEIRIARAADAVRVSFENLKPGNLRAGHFSMPCEVVRILGRALLLASASGDAMNVVFTIEEGQEAKS